MYVLRSDAPVSTRALASIHGSCVCVCVCVCACVPLQQVIEKERRGDYLGKTVQVVPHITDAIQDWIQRVAHQPVDGGCTHTHMQRGRERQTADAARALTRSTHGGYAVVRTYINTQNPVT